MQKMKNSSKWKVEMVTKKQTAETRDGSSHLLITMYKLLSNRQTSRNLEQNKLDLKARNNKRVKNSKQSTLAILLESQALQPNKNLEETRANPQLRPHSHSQDLKLRWLVSIDTLKKSGSWNGKALWIFLISKPASATPTTKLCISEIRWLSKTLL